MSLVVDYAFGAHPPVSVLKDHHVVAVGRYVSSLPANDGNGKNLIPSEKNALHAGGIGIVLFAEEGAQRMLGGHPAGAADARHFGAVVKALGMDGAVMFGAADWDAAPGDQPEIDAYLDGAASVLGRGRTGIYGGFWPVNRALNAGKASFAVQTYAWSGFTVSRVRALASRLSGPMLVSAHDQRETLAAAAAGTRPAHSVLVTRVAGRDLPGTFLFDDRAGLRQGPGGQLGGANVDFDEAVLPDFGQWPRPSAGARTWQVWETKGHTSLQQVAEACHMSPSHILRATAEKFGPFDAAVADYVNGVFDGSVDPSAVMPAGGRLWVLR